MPTVASMRSASSVGARGAVARRRRSSRSSPGWANIAWAVASSAATTVKPGIPSMPPKLAVPTMVIGGRRVLGEHADRVAERPVPRRPRSPGRARPRSGPAGPDRCDSSNGLRRASAIQLTPMRPPMPSVVVGLAVGVDDLGEALDRAGGGVDAVDGVDLVDEVGVDPLADVDRPRLLDAGGAVHDDVDARVAGGEEPVEGLAHGVGEDHRPRHEGDAEDDGEAGEHEAHLVGPQALACEVEHGDLPSEAASCGRGRTRRWARCSSSTMRPSARKTTRSA